MLNHKGIALIFKENYITYDDLNKYIEKYSSSFPITPNEKAIIFAENSLEWVYTFLSLWEIGATSIPVDSKYNEEELSYIINEANPRIIFVSNENEEMVKKLIKEDNTLIINLNDIEFLPLKKNIIKKHDENNSAVICYSSGTTGSPKGVELTRKNIISNAEDIASNTNLLKKNEKNLALLPFHHMYPLVNNIFVSLVSVGAVTVIIEEISSEALRNNLQKHKIETIVAIPKILELMHKGILKKINKNIIAKILFSISKRFPSLGKIFFKRIQKEFGGNLKHIVSGGSRLDPNIEKDLRALSFNIIQGYGLTETSPTVAVNPIDKPKIGSVGKPLSVNEVKIIDGEIVVKGANVMKGYYKKPKETDQVLKDGWFYTGDLGYFDSEGYLYVNGRKKELIVLANGKNVWPEEIENNIKELSENIAEIGIGELEGKISAFILLENRNEEEREKIRELIIDKYNCSVPSYKKILSLYFIETELPKTRIGKIKRFMLPSLIKNREEHIIKRENSSEIYLIIKEYIEENFKKEIHLNSNLELDLSLDSLELIEFLVYLNHSFGLNINIKDLKGVKIVEELVNLIEKKKSKIENKKVNWNQILNENFIPNKYNKLNVISKAFYSLIRFAFRKYFTIEFKGLENIESNVVFAPNHISYIDGFCIASIVPKNILFNSYFVAKEKHTKGFFKNLILKVSNVITLQENNLKENMQLSAYLLKEGKSILIFPEGTRSAILGEFKKSFAILAKELNKKIIPIAIKGSQNILKGKFIKGGSLEITFLPAVDPKNKSYEEISCEVYESVKNELEV